MNQNQTNIVAMVLMVAIVIIVGALLIRTSYSGERMLCHIEPLSESWHYRTKIPPLEKDRCWYDGPRMKARSELYWAEMPSIPPMSIMNSEPDEMPLPPMQPLREFEDRWLGIR
jgi:hypothetical protein